MGWRSIIACVVVTIMLAGGQVLFKLAAESMAERREVSWLSALLSPWLVVAITVYATATILWIAILAREPLSKAYPFVLAGAALVPLLAYAVFDEPLSARYWVGMAVVLAGISLTQSG